jgi:hypothetical protein
MDYGDMIRGLLRGKGDDAARSGRVMDDAVDTVAMKARLDKYLDDLRDADAINDRAGIPRGTYRAPEVPDAPAAPDLSLGSPAWHDLDKSARAYDNILKGRTGNLRNQDRGLVDVARQGIRDAADNATKKSQVGLREAAPAAAVAGLAGVYAATGKKTADIDSTGGTAELANESRPAPVVSAEPDVAAKESANVKRNLLRREMQRADAGVGAYDPRQQAEVLMKDLNNRRMKAGGEVPEAPQMMAQINELLSKSNQRTNARTPAQAQAYAKDNQDSPHAQASALLAQLNEMRRKAGGEVPQAQQIMAEVRRLQAMGDQQRNARTTARS